LKGTPVFSQNRLSQLVQNSKPSVFSIITYDNKNNPLAYGTGFFIDSKGTGITNYHVLEGANSALIKTLDGNHYQVFN
jgi:serine protease Do